MGGSTKVVNTTPPDIGNLRKGMSNWLQSGGGQAQSPNPQPGFNGVPMQSGPRPSGPGFGPVTMASMNGSAQGGYTAQQMPGNGMQNPGMGGPANQGQSGGLWDSGNSGSVSAGLGSGAGAYSVQGMAGGNPASGGPAGGWDMYSSSVGGPNVSAAGSPGAPSAGLNSQKKFPLQNNPTGTYNQGEMANSPFNQIFNQMQPNGPGQLQMTGMTGAPGQINPGMVAQGSYGQMSGPTGYTPQNIQAQQLDPGAYNPSSYMQNVNAQGMQGGQPMPFNRGQVRDTAAQNSGYQGTQSVDQLGGANSAFFRNMQGQLQPAFAQGREEALAAAKAGLGNMGGGSALGNSLGTAMNRSLGNEQATLANYASQGLQTEVGRQLQDAGQRSQVDMANANRGLQSDQGNQGADMGFLNQLLGQQGQQGNLALGYAGQNLQGQMANQQMAGQLGQAGMSNALNAAQGNQSTNLAAQGQNAQNGFNAWQQANQFNQNAQGQNMGANLQAAQGNQAAGNNAQAQNIANGMNQQQFNANLQQGQFNTQAGLNQTYQQLVSQMGQQNASNYLAMLMGMGTTGVGQQATQSGGAGALLGPIASGVGSYLGSRGR